MKRKILLLVLGILIFASVCFLDHVTGPEISSSFFYFLPIIFFALFFGIFGGIAAGFLSAVSVLVLDLISKHPYQHPAIPYINAVLQGCIFFMVAVVVFWLNAELKRQKIYNEIMAKAKAETERAAKIKSDFCDMVSHEIRTPMTTIRESIQLMDEGLAGPVDEKQKPYLAMAKRNVDRLIHLINNVLDFSKLDQGKKKLDLTAHDLNKLVSESAAFYSPLAAKKALSLRCELDAQVPAILCDEEAISQVLGNLIGNAIKFTQKGEIVIQTAVSDGQALVLVRDPGCGIPAGEIGRLFRYFEQIHSKGRGRPEGSGLGLAISRRLIELHHGKIWAESEEGKGTTIYFSLPAENVQAGG